MEATALTLPVSSESPCTACHFLAEDYLSSGCACLPSSSSDLHNSHFPLEQPGLPHLRPSRQVPQYLLSLYLKDRLDGYHLRFM